MNMELWLDTIDFDLIKEAARLNILTGVTTNPSILSQANTAPKIVLKTLLDIQPGYVAVQVIANKLDNMLIQARKLAALDKRIIVKIPANAEGFRAIALLKQENIPTMATAIFEPVQVLFSAIAGAKYAAPYMGRIAARTSLLHALRQIKKMQAIIEKQGNPLKILAAAIHAPSEFVDCACIGVAAITLPSKVYESLFASHEAVEESLKKFEDQWASNPQTDQSDLFR